MKIIGVDNLNRETVSDILIAEKFHPGYAARFVRELNEEENGRFYKIVDDDYELYTYEE